MSIIKTQFYFIRHGESEFNLNPHLVVDEKAALTTKGKKQAQIVRPVIESLPIQTICVSPYQRAIDTKDIIAENVNCPVVVIHELAECSLEIWKKMTEQEGDTCPHVSQFLQRVLTGVNKALSHLGPVLIVAHGGVHYAMCQHMGIEEYEKKIDHCVPAHFSLCEKNEWRGKHLRDFFE